MYLKVPKSLEQDLERDYLFVKRKGLMFITVVHLSLKQRLP